MGKFIEEFYYGNLDPQARSTKENKAVQKQMEVLMLNEDFLTENLSGESKKKFLEFSNAWSVVNGESNLDSFIMGFRLGANFTYDTFINDEAPFVVADNLPDKPSLFCNFLSKKVAQRTLNRKYIENQI